MKSKRGIAAAAIVVSALPFALCAQTLQPAGTVWSGGSTLPSGRVTAHEYRSTVRMFGYTSGMLAIPYNVVAGKVYTASCLVPGTNQRKMFASFGTKSSATAGVTDRNGTIVTANVSSTGAVSGFSQTNFPLCEDMNGIVASNDCSTVAALCRVPSTRTGATKDLVQELPADKRDWITKAGEDHMWLYVWNSPSMSSALPVNPNASYVVARNLGDEWEYGHRDIVMSGTDYGLSIKGSVGTHETNHLIIVNRATPKIDPARGWITNSCGDGHVHTNRPVASATNGKFMVLCTTDGDSDTDPMDFTGGIYGTMEDKPEEFKNPFKSIYMGGKANQFNGGANSFVALPGGGFMGVYAAPSNLSNGRTEIHLVRFNSLGEYEWTKVARSNTTYSLGYPQIGYLGKDGAGNVRLLVGWGRLFDWSSYKFDTAGDQRRIASLYTVQEFNVDGAPVSAIRDVTHGWGELDKMTSIGNGRVGWAYTPDPNLQGATKPVVMSPTLQWTTYTSTSM